MAGTRCGAAGRKHNGTFGEKASRADARSAIGGIARWVFEMTQDDDFTRRGRIRGP